MSNDRFLHIVRTWVLLIALCLPPNATAGPSALLPVVTRRRPGPRRKTSADASLRDAPPAGRPHAPANDTPHRFPHARRPLRRRAPATASPLRAGAARTRSAPAPFRARVR